MNRKQLLTLVAIMAVLGLTSIIVYKYSSSTWEPARSAAGNGKVLGDFDPNAVAKLVIQDGTATLILDKKDDKWVVPDRGDYPADFARIGEFLRTLWQLKPVEDEEAGPSQLGRFNLLPPAKGDGTGTLVDLQDKNSKRIAALLVGKKLLKKSPQVPDQEGYPVGCYVMPEGSNPPKILQVSEPLLQVNTDPTMWLDKAFIKIERIQSVTCSFGYNDWTMTRDTDGGNDWKLTGIKQGESVDQSKVPPFVSMLGSPAFTDVLPPGTLPAGFDRTLTVTTFDQFTYTLKFGKPAGDNVTMSVAVTADLPKARTPGKDEKPEDKQRLDDEFAAKSKQLADALADAKTFESRIYLVSKAAIDPLFKARIDLLTAPQQPAALSPVPVQAPDEAPAPAPAKPSPSPKETPKKSKNPQ